MAAIAHAVACRVAFAVLAAFAPARALAQRSTENVVTSAEDAFGAAIGQDRIGIYGEQDVRAFSPLKAGNVRVEGVYFDQVAAINFRARASTVVRVGITGVDFPFPAPSGIVDHQLRASGDERIFSAGAGRQGYGGYETDLDVQGPIIPGRLSIAGGFNFSRQEYPDGARNDYYTVAIVPRLRLGGGGDITPLVSLIFIRDGKSRPVITSSRPFVPPLPRARDYFGQSWAQLNANNHNVGASARIPLGQSWAVRGGLYRSWSDKLTNFSEVIAVASPTGAGLHQVVADPRQLSRSLSGEAQLFWNGGDKALRHRVLFMVRGRDRLNETGGSDKTIPLWPIVLGSFDPRQPEPSFRFGKPDQGRIRQLTGAVGYVGRLQGVGQINLGLQKTDYRQSYDRQGVITSTTEKPWLLNGALVANPRRWLTFYGTYMRGLEETGVAPENAANRNEQLPASLTTQIDGGVRFSHGASRLVLGAFQISKPYYSFDAANRYVELGDVAHRGVEVSFAGQVAERLNLLAGAVLMDPVVTGEARDLARVGKRPVGTTAAFARIDADYRTAIEGLSFSAAMVYNAQRTASTRAFAELGGRQLTVPATATFDLGARYRFKVGDATMSARLQVTNLFDKASWKVLASNSYQLNDSRKLQVYVVADF